MQFHLVYRGPLKANGNRDDKHLVRRAIDSQLRELMSHSPLNWALDLRYRFLDQMGWSPRPGVLREHDGQKFLVLLPSNLDVVVELEVLMLRPEAPGVIVRGGDIDNRLKTLFDALRVPHSPGELPSRAPDAVEEAICCLLEDDAQIVTVRVETDRLLEPVASQTEVQLFIKVSTRLTKVTHENLGLA